LTGEQRKILLTQSVSKRLLLNAFFYCFSNAVTESFVNKVPIDQEASEDSQAPRAVVSGA